MGVLPWWLSIFLFQDINKYSTWDLVATVQHKNLMLVNTRLKAQDFNSTLSPNSNNYSTQISGSDQEKEKKGVRSQTLLGWSSMGLQALEF